MGNDLIRLSRILEEVGQLDGIRGLKLSDEGTCGLDLKNGAQIRFEYVQERGRLFIYTPLMVLPHEKAKRSALLAAMLSCNFLESGSGKGCLALLEHMEQAVYQIGLDAADVTVEQLDRTIDALLRCRGEILRVLENDASVTPRGVRASRPVHAPTTIALRFGLNASGLKKI